jgi:sugar-specific transcriptional regulator TrmB
VTTVARVRTTEEGSVTVDDGSELALVLEDAGLSPYQADAYVTLLELGAAPATEVAEASDVPDPRIYDVLRDLESGDYIETYEQDLLYARAVDPEAVLENLRTRATRFTEAADEIERRWEEPPIEVSLVSLVKRFETVKNYAGEAIRDATDRVQVSLSAAQYERLRPALEAARARGANVDLSLHTTDADARALPSREDVAAVCTEARVRRSPAPFVAIVDRTVSCFAPNTGSANEYGVLVNDRTHTYVLHWFFMTVLWDPWEVYYTTADRGPPTDYLDIRYCVRDVVSWLDDGATVDVLIEGIDTETGEDRIVEGTVREVLTNGIESADAPIAQYSGQVGLVVDTVDGPVEVGGWGAMVEEVEAHRITVRSVE